MVADIEKWEIETTINTLSNLLNVLIKDEIRYTEIIKEDNDDTPYFREYKKENKINQKGVRRTIFFLKHTLETSYIKS